MSDSKLHLSAAGFRTAFVLLLVIAVSLLFLHVAGPFLTPLLLAAIFAGLCRPLYLRVVRLVRGRPSLGAALTLLILFLLIAGPVSAFIGLITSQALQVSDLAIPWVQQHFGAKTTFNAHDWLVQKFPSLADYVPQQTQILEAFGRAAKAAGAFLVSGVTQFTAGTANVLLDLFIMFYALYFFFRDGPKIIEKIFYYAPLNHDDEILLLDRLTSITRATIKGTIFIAIVQGTLAGLAFWVAGIYGAAFWGTLTAVMSMVPGIGGALVWIPAVLYLFLSGQTLPAVLLLIWCAVIVSTIDNMLRPRLVGKDAQMPDLLILIGTLGGLFVFGPIGFIVGPVVCGLFLTVWTIYGRTFKSVLPPVGRMPDGPTGTADHGSEDS